MAVTPETQTHAPLALTFVCYARHDERFVLGLAAALRSRGLPIWIDQWDIVPGADWSQAIDEALSVCTNVLVVLSPEAVASEEVRGELRVALDAGKPIVPLVYRSCNIPRQLRLRQRIDLTHSPDLSEASLEMVANALRGDVQPRHLAPSVESDRRGRQALLQDVKDEAKTRLRSIGAGTAVSIPLEQQPHQVERPWDGEVGVPLVRRASPPVSDIVEVFDDPAVAGRLLILGAPGSGKTTALLRLMQELVDRAERDERHPIPVLISLASWTIRDTIGEWLVAELKTKYGVRADLSVRWRDDSRIAPLLDGLDELPAEIQEACVKAINAFQQDYEPAHVAVCCRLAEYENLTAKLRLRGAVCLLPLEADQIRTYLDHNPDLWPTIRADPELMEMARSPLLVSFMSALPSEQGAMRWQDAASATERRRRLFDDYVASRTSPGATDAHYSREPMLRWLRQLALILKHHSQPEFLIERMQPDWLDSSLRRWCYRAGVLILSATVVYAAMSGMSALFELVPRGNVGLALQRSEYSPILGEGSAFDLMVPYLIAVAIGSLIASRRTIVPIETLTWSWPRAYGNLRRWAQTGTFAALDYGMPLSVLGCCVWYLSHIDLGDHVWQQAGEITGITGGLLVAAALTLIRPSTWLARKRPTMRPRLTYALAAAAMCTIVTGWSVMWIGGLVSGLAVFLVAGFSDGVNDRCREMLPKWLIAAAVSGATVAGVSWGALSPSVPPLALLSMWVAGAVAAALIAVVAISLAVRFGEWWRPRRLDTASGAPGWVRTGAIGLAAGVLAGLLALLSTRTGSDQPIRAATSYAWYLHSGLLQFLLMLLLWGAALTTVAAVTAGVFGRWPVH